MIGIVLTLFLQFANAADFNSAFLAFEMPNGFSCKKSTGTYICMNEAGPKMKDEIIVVSFKRTGPQDALSQYAAQMRQPRTIRDKNKMSSLSQVLEVKDVSANAVPWVQAQHMNSEIEDYFTSYWVTKVGGVGMLISYSAHKNKKAQWQSQSEAIRNSLTVDSKAAEALLAQANANHPDIDDPTAPGVTKTQWEPVTNTSNQNQTMVAKLLAGTVTVGSVTLKKSHAFLGIMGLIALVLLMKAMRR
jgi:hypothetical protein